MTDEVAAEIRSAIQEAAEKLERIAVAIDRQTAALPAAVATAQQFRRAENTDRQAVADALRAMLDSKPALKPSHRRAIEDAAHILRH